MPSSPSSQQPRAPPPEAGVQADREDIALHGFSRDKDQDGRIDPLSAHLHPAEVQQQVVWTISLVNY